MKLVKKIVICVLLIFLMPVTAFAHASGPLMPEDATPPPEMPEPSPTARDISRSAILPDLFVTTQILGVSYMPTRYADVFQIMASSPITAVSRLLLEDNRLVVDIPNSTTELLGNLPFPDNFNTINGLRASQFEAGISRVVFDLPDYAVFSIALTQNRRAILVSIYHQDPRTELPEHLGGNEFIRFDHTDNSLRIPRNWLSPMNIEQILHTDRYLQLHYILTLPAEMAWLGHGRIDTPENSLVSHILWQLDNYGRPRITIHSREIIAITIGECHFYHHIRIMRPREKYPRIVIIDPGDGGTMPGAIHGGIYERNLNLAVGLKVRDLVNASGFVRAYMTRDTCVYVSLADRAAFGNAHGDIFVSIHHNAANQAAVRGVESFFYATPADADRPITSRALAQIMTRNLAEQTGRRTRETRQARFVVLTRAEIPATLVEVGFMSNPDELATLINPAYQWRAATAIYQGIIEAFSRYSPARN